MAEPILQIKGLNSFYGDFQALYGVDMHINEGEVLAIIGANGAGKTTLLRSIAGLIDNDTDQVAYRGEKIGAMRADLIANTQMMTDLVENAVREYPDQWLWMHKRWRSRPKGDPSPNWRVVNFTQ